MDSGDSGISGNYFKLMFEDNSIIHFTKKLILFKHALLIKDSVSFQIDESLKDLYQGSGGSGSEAAIRIQFEYDMLNGCINDLTVNAFNEQDSDSLATIEKIQAIDLVIRDLAYMSLDVLRRLIEKLVLFICRVNPIAKIYELNNGEYEGLNFDKIKRYMNKHRLPCIEKQVYLIIKYKLPARLMIYLLADDAVN